MAGHEPDGTRQAPVPGRPHGARSARNVLPSGPPRRIDVGELLTNSVLHLGGNEAAVKHVLDVNLTNLTSGDPQMDQRHGIALYAPLNHLSQHDAERIAHGLVGARRHASPEARDLYTAAVHHMGYRFDEQGHIHKVRDADFSAAMKNAAFRAHIAAEHDRAAHQQDATHRNDGARGVEMSHSSAQPRGNGREIRNNADKVPSISNTPLMAPGLL